MSENENKFRFKKNSIEIELSGNKDFLDNQINNWKPFIEKISFMDIDNLKQDNNLDDMYNDISNNTLESFKEDASINLENISIPLSESIEISNDSQIKVTKNINLEEFIELKNPKNDTEKVLSAIYYFDRYEKYESISEMDLYKALNISNIENHLAINMENGYLIFLENKNNSKFYTLTYSGEIYVREEIGLA